MWTRHENGAGATPTCGRRRQRADQLRLAAAHSSSTGAPWVEQQKRTWPNCTNHHESAHQNDYPIQVYLLNTKFKRAVTINAMLNRSDKAKTLTVTLK